MDCKERELLIIATKSDYKLNEFKRLLPNKFEVISMKNIGFDKEYRTIKYNLDNTKNKLEALERFVLSTDLYTSYTDIFLLADDSGASFTSLPDKFGLKPKKDVEALPKGWSSVIDLLKDKDRSVKFTCTLMLKKLKGNYETVTTILEGKVPYKERGSNGFGFDRIFEVNGKTLAEMTDEEKDLISPRKEAVNFILKSISHHTYTK